MDPKPGDICQGCSEYWKRQHKAQRKLRPLTGKTMNKHLMVLACDYCDGEPIFDIAGKQEPPAHA